MMEQDGLGGFTVITSQGWCTDNHCLYMDVVYPGIFTGKYRIHTYLAFDTVFTHNYVYNKVDSVSFMKPTPFATISIGGERRGICEHAYT